jgi:hypothetical protein
VHIRTFLSYIAEPSGGTNHALDLENPDNLGAESTDAGTVVNLKWSFSDSHTRLLNGGWVREQVITDLPASNDISGAQQHLSKGAIRELHWHRVVGFPRVFSLFLFLSFFSHFFRPNGASCTRARLRCPPWMRTAATS